MKKLFSFLFPLPFRKSVTQIQLNDEAPTPIPKNFLFNAGTFERSYRARSVHGNCKCDTCIHDMMEKYVRQVLVQPTGNQSMKDRIAEKIRGAEEDYHNKVDSEKILNRLLDELRRMT